MAEGRFGAHPLAGRLLLLLAGLVLGLGLAEGLLRLTGFQPRIHVVYRENFRLSDNPRLAYELQPGSKDGHGRISSAGLRDHEFSLQRRPGTYRVVVLGDSVAYGLRVDAEQAFPKQLERLLASGPANSPHFEVLNLGVSGYNASQSVERLRTLGLAYQPDLILYAYSLNDPQPFSLELQGLTAMERTARTELRPRQAIWRWLSHSRLFLLVWRRWQDPWTRDVPHERASPDYRAVVTGSYEAYFEDLHRGESWDRVEEQLVALKRLGTQAGARVLVAIWPIELRGGRVAPLPDLHRRLVAAVREQGLEALDLGPPMARAASLTEHPLFVDPFHPTPRGHQVAAAALLDWLARSDLLTDERAEAIRARPELGWLRHSALSESTEIDSELE